MKPVFKRIDDLMPDEASVIAAPSWLVEKLTSNHVPLTVLKDGKLPDILSADELIYYFNYYITHDDISSDLGVLRDISESYRRKYSNDMIISMTETTLIERRRLLKRYDDEARVTYLMSIVGPEIDAMISDKYVGVELKTIRYENLLIVTYGPTEESVCNDDALKEVFKYCSKFVANNIMSHTSLYAYLMLGATKFKRIANSNSK